VSGAEFVEDLGEYWLAEALLLEVRCLYTYVHYSADRNGCKLLLTDRTLCLCVYARVCMKERGDTKRQI